MAETRTTRMGLPQWSSGSTDSPSREDFNEAFQRLEERAARYAQGTLAARPTAGVPGRVYAVVGDPDASKNNQLFYDNGTSWFNIGSVTSTQTGNVITSPSAGTVALRVNGASGQTANLQEWRKSDGTLVGYINSAGGANFASSAYSGATSFEDLDVTDQANINLAVINDLSVLQVLQAVQFRSASKRLDDTSYKTQINSDGTARMDGLIPPGTILMWGGSTAPSGYLLCQGQELQRSTYPDLFNNIGVTFGAPSGTTFKIPDMRTRFPLGAGYRPVGSGDTYVTEVDKHVNLAHNHNHSIANQSISHTHTVATSSAASTTTGSGGEHSHTASASTAPNHTHSIDSANMTVQNNTATGGGAARVTDGSTHSHGGSTGSAGAHSHTITVDSGGAHTHSVSLPAHSHGLSTDTSTHNHGGATGTNGSPEHPFLSLNFIIKT